MVAVSRGEQWTRELHSVIGEPYSLTSHHISMTSDNVMYILGKGNGGYRLLLTIGLILVDI